jgi:hypothetical protein
MTAAVVVTTPKMQARRIREEAKVVRSMNFPVPISILSPVREAKLCPTVGAFACSSRPIRASNSERMANQAAIQAKMLLTNNFRPFAGSASKSGNQVRWLEFLKD